MPDYGGGGLIGLKENMKDMLARFSAHYLKNYMSK
jgi:hypothetical protein